MTEIPLFSSPVFQIEYKEVILSPETNTFIT